MKWLAALAVVLAFVAGALTAGYQTYLLGWWRMNYPSLERFPVQGIDVSHHQGKIDWPKVAADPRISFVYLKATEGGDHKDRLFQQNWIALKDTRLARGAYHFFTFCRPGADQAKNLLESMPIEAGILPLAVDLEFGGNCERRPSVEDMAKEVHDFVRILRSSDDRSPIFYVTAEFFERYMAGHESLYPAHALWRRNIYSEPRQETCTNWSFWQFAAQGLVDGISGPVDLNAFCGDAAAFQRLLKPQVP